ncbi:MAG: Na+/H+ antiporter subunit E [Candidatus Bipolaricaulaceae bacterium]
MRKLVRWATTAALALAAYLLLVLWSGGIGLWSLAELIGGAVISAFIGLVAAHLLWERGGWRMFQPHRWVLFLFYLVGPFFWAMARANLDVAWRVITGRIRPGIVRFNPQLRTDLGRTLLANSITLTPGTLTVDVDEATGDFFVHWINVKDEDPSPGEVCGPFPVWARRIAE